MYRYIISALNADAACRYSMTYHNAAKAAFAMCRQFGVEVTIERRNMGVMERFVLADGEVVPA